jgi:pyroglutamyl-peptidase
MKKLLLTAFEPFAGETINPSFEVAKAIEQFSFTGAEVQTLLLPVDRFQAIEMAHKRISEAHPEIIILLGEGSRRFRINPERVAINVDDFRIPDNTGNQPKGEAIVEGAPAAYFSTLPIYAIVERLIAAKIPAAISNTAGTYLCNRLFYSVMNFIAVEKLPIKAGFIHLPYVHEQTIEKPLDYPSLSLATTIEAVKIVIETSLAETASQSQT